MISPWTPKHEQALQGPLPVPVLWSLLAHTAFTQTSLCSGEPQTLHGSPGVLYKV